MIALPLSRIAQIVGGVLTGGEDRTIHRICTDSRAASPGALFVALKGSATDGHRFLADAQRNGAAAALVAEGAQVPAGLAAIAVPSPLAALQDLARWHRREALGRVLAITGSNGKTVVKNMLETLLARRDVFASPGSFNSQLGLPVAVLSAGRSVELAVLEAGISQPGEMARLERIAAPDIGILVNIGKAHFASFGSREAIAAEKMALFASLPPEGWLIVPDGEPLIEPHLAKLKCRIVRVGADAGMVRIVPGSFVSNGQVLDLIEGEERHSVEVRTRSPEIVADLRMAVTAARLLGVPLREIAGALEGYAPSPTRMEVLSSSEGIRIINDAHSADPLSVLAAIRTAALSTPAEGRFLFAFGGMRELAGLSLEEHARVGACAAEYGCSHLALVGPDIPAATAEGYRARKPDGVVMHAADPDALQHELRPLLRRGDTVLFKGPRGLGLSNAARHLSGSIAQRALWVDLGAIAGNIAKFRRHCGGEVAVMAVLKALAYGTDLVQLARWMPQLGVAHIGVSSTQEGIAARLAGASQEIYVFLPDRDDMDALAEYRLTPVLYSRSIVERFLARAASRSAPLPVHLKVDTGMHRVGVEPGEAVALARRIRDCPGLRLDGLATHFASAEDAGADDATLDQIATFDAVIAALKAEGFDGLRIHAANTAGTIRFPQAHYNMVRVGIGLYGIHAAPVDHDPLALELAIGVTSHVASTREFSPGSRFGYNATFTAPRRVRVGVVPYGYDDGMPRSLSGKGHVLIGGRPAPIVGAISMDQMLVDVTDIGPVEDGAEVLLYGTHGGHVIRPEAAATLGGTIAHELMVRIGRKVQRIYIEP
ncbi:alanine racemase [Sphingomonas canadensis]|uniref:Alanine racemase n=1 Tax=Sphingomonas canadensis TaxID=1219257 RepID=A0ABW3H2Y9_9SPHN|nr:alanine racemase [Sphingomonas canadensis]MCW3835702.1 alanine racemase [Sphingomonas canadensis]